MRRRQTDDALTLECDIHPTARVRGQPLHSLRDGGLVARVLELADEIDDRREIPRLGLPNPQGQGPAMPACAIRSVSAARSRERRKLTS